MNDHLFSKTLVVGFSFTLGFGVALAPRSGYSASSGDLDLSGTVAAVCEVVVTPVAGVADNLPLGAAATNLSVASVNERCNDPIGYTMSAVSAHSGKLMPLGASTDSVSYSISYNGAPADLSGATPVTDVNAPTGNAGVNKNVSISYANPGFIAADTYADTITFTIAAK